MLMKDISVIILTFNEEIHIERCIKSLLPITNKIFVIDSFSTDDTKNIAEYLGCSVIQNKWINYATQFQFGLAHNPFKTEWIMRIDADEIITEELANEIIKNLDSLPSEISGIFLKLKQYYLGKWIRFGGRYPLKLLRIWRAGKGEMEHRWMDEHIKIIEGTCITFKNDFIHDNLNTLTWMINKHNNYATREAIDQLNQEYNLFKYDSFLDKKQILANATHRTRFLKNLAYPKQLILVRSILYFIYRYFFLLGFLDGKEGLIYHFLQGFWYRFLADAKIVEIKYFAKIKKISLMQAIEEYSGYKIK
jgi:glycosyltransferase involved in cell wall biosynthesis